MKLQTLAAFYPTYNKPDRVYHVLRHFRKHYPTATIHLVADGGCNLAPVAWQFWTKEPWRLDGEVMLGMLGESLVLAVALMVIGRLQDLVFQRIESNQVIASVSGSRDTIEYLVSFVGAGIYEETLFRLLLLPAAYYCLSAVGVPSVISMTIAMTLSALAFSSAHYIGPMADEFVWFNFIFRWLAGLFFATVFVLRGFGIAVGAHAAYDILVGVLHFQL